MRAVAPAGYEPHLSSHRNAVNLFIQRAQAIAPEQWEAPLGGGKWSPAQIAEHLRLTYEVVSGEMEGGQGIAIRTKPWQQAWIRVRYLPQILRSGRLPAGARAPREARPGDGPFDRAATLAALAHAATRFEEALADRWDRADAILTHHLFGKMTGKKGIRFLTVHTLHHTRQLPA
jgi:hypothetical protein